MGSHAPAPSALTLAHPSTPCTAGRSGLPASWGLTLTLGRPPRGSSHGSWCRNAWDWGPPSPSQDSLCQPAATWAARGTAGHSGWENGRALRAPRDLQRLPVPKCLGPHSSSLAPSPRPGPPLPHSWRIIPAGLLVANTNPRTAPEGPLTRGLALQHTVLGTPNRSARLTLPPRHQPGR